MQSHDRQIDGHEPAPISDSERLDRLRLIRSENVGPITFRQLLAKFGSATAALGALPELASRGGRRRPLKVCPSATAERELDTLREIGAEPVHIGEPDYPAVLAEADDAPPVLAVLGHAHLLQRRAVAVVGARNASINGRRFAETLARDLAEAGIVVASGMARGIDSAAHVGALEGGTVAVLAGGIDVIYPKENHRLYEEIRERGAIVSEIPPGIQPQAQHFPRRNRIISGLARGIVVVEAAKRSGSLITARLAGEQGREVFAVPGSPLDPRCRGANDLIRNGATLVESAGDVIAGLEGMLAPPLAERRGDRYAPPAGAATDEAGLAAARKSIVELLGHAPVGIDELVRETGAAPALIWTVLLELELAGRLDRQPGNLVALLATPADPADRPID